MRAFRFGLVGLLAAAVHMGGFWLLQRLFGLGNVSAWLTAFVAAATVAWLLNRGFTFADRRRAAMPGEWLSYLVAATLGAAAHFATFQLAVSSFDLFALYPALAIVPGSLASFAVTYAGASSFVFRRARKSP